MTQALQTLIAAGESQTLEFKTSFDKASIESLVAFANAQGGTVLVGVTDAAKVQGVTLGKETLNEWPGQIKSATSPALIPDIAAYTEQGKTVVVIRMSEFPVKPVNTRGRYFKRIASSNHQLTVGEIADLYLQSLQLSWDAHQAGTRCPQYGKRCSTPSSTAITPTDQTFRSKYSTTKSPYLVQDCFMVVSN